MRNSYVVFKSQLPTDAALLSCMQQQKEAAFKRRRSAAALSFYPNKPWRGGANSMPRKVVQRGDRVREARRLLRKRCRCRRWRWSSSTTPPPATDDESSDVGTWFSKQDNSTRCHRCISGILYNLCHHNYLSLPITSILQTANSPPTLYPVATT